jgi:hypothetical protein
MKAELNCGAVVDINFKEGAGIVEFEIEPAAGTLIGATAYISKKGTLRVNMTVESVLGLYQLLALMLTPRKRKRWYEWGY